jgi:hypothetical protein
MGLKLALKEIGKQMLAEGSEEVAAEVLDTALDMLVAGDMSEFEQYKKQLIAGGMGEDEANSAAIKQFFVNNVLSAGLGGAVSGGVFGAFGVGGNNYNAARNNRIAERARVQAQGEQGTGDVAADGVTTPARGATPPTEGNGTEEFEPYNDDDGFGTPEFGGYDTDTIQEWLDEDEIIDAPDIETAARIINTVARGQLQELGDADFDVLESSPDFAEIVAGVDEAVREAADADRESRTNSLSFCGKRRGLPKTARVLVHAVLGWCEEQSVWGVSVQRVGRRSMFLYRYDKNEHRRSHVYGCGGVRPATNLEGYYKKDATQFASL